MVTEGLGLRVEEKDTGIQLFAVSVSFHKLLIFALSLICENDIAAITSGFWQYVFIGLTLCEWVISDDQPTICSQIVNYVGYRWPPIWGAS